MYSLCTFSENTYRLLIIDQFHDVILYLQRRSSRINYDALKSLYKDSVRSLLDKIYVPDFEFLYNCLLLENCKAQLHLEVAPLHFSCYDKL